MTCIWFVTKQAESKHYKRPSGIGGKSAFFLSEDEVTECRLHSAHEFRGLLPVILGTTVLSMMLDSVCLSACSSSSWPCP